MLLRANYVVNGEFSKQDFVGENVDRDFASWLAETARKEDSFQYLGRDTIQSPINWHYNDSCHLEVWNGLLPIGEPDMVVKNNHDITWFFEKYLGVPMGDVHIGDGDVAENPGGWFEPKEQFYEDSLGIELKSDKIDELFEEDIVLANIQRQQPMSKFEIWFRTFIEEKDLPVVNWEFDFNDNIHIMDNYDMVEIICELPAENQKMIKDKLVQIDFVNGNVNHFLKYLAQGYIETNF